MKKRTIVVTILCLVLSFCLLGVGSLAKDKAPEATTEKKEVQIPADATAGQKNAVEKAKQYISLMGFSEEGLKDQLIFDKFTEDEAAFGAKYCGADWNEMAVKKAQQYLDMMAFSKEQLIEQLKYDKFTDEQAQYGADQTYK